ncbi:MAG: hypothetical protein LBB36_02475 [Fibromonadaceae bacterium]|jgi:hypothetical protein|nr:hypothetical protein [Fibromonadaceae bacterium]
MYQLNRSSVGKTHRVLRTLFTLLAFTGIVFFGCTQKEDLEEPDDCLKGGCTEVQSSSSSAGLDGSSSSGESGTDDSSSSAEVDGSSSSGESGTDDSSSSAGLDGSSSSGEFGNSSSSETTWFSSSSEIYVPPALNCDFDPEWCGGSILFSDVETTNPGTSVGDGPRCIFATAIEKMGNESQGQKINGMTLPDGGRCGNTGWGQKSCTEALANATGLKKADGGYYIWVGEWAGDFNITSGTPVCSDGGDTPSDLTCKGLVTTGTVGTEIAKPTVQCNGTTLTGSDIAWTGAPTNNWIPSRVTTYKISATAICGGSRKTTDCGSVVISEASNFTCTGLAQSGTAGTAITQPTVQCNGTTVTSGLTWTGQPSWTNPVANTYNVSVRAGSGNCSGNTAQCGSITVNPAAQLTCVNMPTTGIAGTALTQPTIRCGNTTVTSSGLTWTNAPNWTNPVAGTYNVSVKANSGSCTNTAQCATLTVRPPPTITCNNGNSITATVTAGQAITPPVIRCDNNVVPSGNITWSASSAINWNSPVTGTYNNIRATPTSGDCKDRQVSCTGTLTVSASSGGTSSSSNAVVTPSSSSTGGNVPSYPPLIQGGAGVQSGYATRYWDSCKAHCSWNYAAPTSNRCKACTSNGTTQIAANDNNKSSCDGGNSFACFDQTPKTISTNLAYAFAATPGGGNDCGKCYQLQFTNTVISGKTLIVIASNIGHDVKNNQFDIMIPGGGVGRYNALTNQIKNNGGPQNPIMGEEYGGFLSKCQQDKGWNASESVLSQCVKDMCATNFPGAALSLLKAGCDWFIDWYRVADNPNLLYKQVDCPQDLIDKYKATMF